MTPNGSQLASETVNIVCRFFSFIVIASLAVVYVTSNLVRLHLAGDDDTQLNLSLAQLIEQHAIEYGWALKFVVNCFGYACIFVPGILIYKYTKAIKYLERYGKNVTLLEFKLVIHISIVHVQETRADSFRRRFDYVLSGARLNCRHTLSSLQRNQRRRPTSTQNEHLYPNWLWSLTVFSV